MPRSLWTGSLSFGLVNVPVSMISAVRDLDLHFRQLHEKDGAPIEVQRWCSKEDVEVPFEEIAHGYELDDGKEVVLTDEELEASSPAGRGRSRSSSSWISTTSTRSTSTTPTCCFPDRTTTARRGPTDC